MNYSGEAAKGNRPRKCDVINDAMKNLEVAIGKLSVLLSDVKGQPMGICDNAKENIISLAETVNNLPARLEIYSTMIEKDIVELRDILI